MTYEYTDKIITYLDEQLVTRYARLKSLVSFDELNVLEEVNALYREVQSIIRKAFVLLANKVYSSTKKTDFGSIDEEWVDDLLGGYDPVSKYVFTHEIDRRCARLIEAILASDNKSQEIDSALRGMSFMCRLYADRITDEATMQAYRDEGEDYVMWVAETDERVCSVCRKRDGIIYKIDDVPKDPHPNCRCKRERV